MRPGRKIRLIIADDHPVVVEGIKASLSADENIVIVGEAKTGQECIEKIRELEPDIVLLDVNLTDIKGYDVISKSRKESPDTKFLIFSVYDNIEYINKALRAGASGYVLKNASVSELINAIESILAGNVYFSKKVQKVIVNGYINQIDNPDEKSQELTPRELEILRLVADGHTNKEIGEKLGISTRTVETHRERIMVKLGIRTTAGLTKYAIKRGIIEI